VPVSQATVVPVSPHRQRRTISVAFGLLLMGCPDPEPPLPDATMDRGLSAPCGGGQTRLELGKGDPFVALDAFEFTVDQGFQGGYHVDVSVRIRGAFDPDAADVDLSLFQGERRIAHHLTRDWYLELNPAGPSCDYLLARLVLVDEEGGLMAAERVPDVLEGPIRLDADLRSPGGGVQASHALELTKVVLLR